MTMSESEKTIPIPIKKASLTPKRYGTFEGVFKPTLLTILGVIMYLRIGWVVGNAGLLGGLLVVILAVSITLSTGLSLSSIATNTRIGAGGPYAMISKSLGLEVGGSVGFPLFISQSLAVAMYIFGFREGWLSIFPNHSQYALVVDLTVFVVVFLVAFISAGLAFRVQYLVMVLIGASLISIFASSVTWGLSPNIIWWGDFQGSVENNLSGITFWGVFAVFFPATTGIMSGVNMSGELENSRQNIPIGTLSAIGVSTIIYIVLCWWVSLAGTTDELLGNYTIMVDKALWSPAVLGGLLAATFSAALSSIVGASRILMALGKDNVLPNGQWLAKLSSNGEPRRALLISSGITLAGLLMRDLNAIAPLITMFFLITYATINLVILIESSLGLMNFRPTFKLTRWIPLYGGLGCLLSMIVINSVFSLAAIAVVIIIYLRLVSLPKEKRPADARSGIFVAIAEWAATKVIQMDITSARAWKPTLLVPVENGSQLLGEFRLLLDLCQPEGSIKLLGLASNETMDDLSFRLNDLSNSLRKRRIFTTSSLLDVTNDAAGIIGALQALQSAFFRPNVLFLRYPNNQEIWQQILPVFDEARRLNVGVMLFGLHPLAGLGRAEVVNLWIRPQLEDLPLSERLRKGSINLALLMSLRLFRAWKGDFNLISVVSSSEEVKTARDFLEELRDFCRIPCKANTIVLVGDLNHCIAKAPQGDMDFIGLQSIPDFNFVRNMMELTGSSCLFMSDSGSESAIA
ncbi:MAG: sodium transporter [Moorea sp. SIO2B7]|nr:sodium transporter [Moorena sp. SIO2B7]